ncbi:phytanoyl-CoA dioxygenase family protein [Granulicella mallensis]|uniref:Phytanoyl-CoA dioxygenase n=1 Tax=Granulicella mallensis (strain ATCC BAA-1857 / DSM 23137 / MP5ACTX8) TaxID=682795 RepID=G8NPA8_GRAMM|nr:phytanoyl-CoA dioxygenase family protein [Granulicella mallensis]AEU34828.1 Phytanoyl-CoA dioxygenase [Granulicella mallensis MP5ACTX8]
MNQTAVMDEKAVGKPGDNKLTPAISRESLHLIQKKLPLRVLSEDDFAHWQTYGFVVVKQAVPRANVEALKKLLWEFQEMDPNDTSTWNAGQLRDHAMKELNNSGMVEIYNHQALWDNRQKQRVYDAFVDIWDDEKLWVTIDRANLNTPNRSGRAFSGFIHTDVDTTLEPLPVNVQGVLSLVDVDGETGGFQCVPELFHTFEEWKKLQPEGRDGFRPNVEGFEVYPVPMKAGDLMIFNSLLAHGIRPNTSEDKVRMAQYISMTPAAESNDELRERRIQSWRERRAPEGFAFPGDPREWERTKYETAALTPLGRKLLGLDSWS